MFLSLVSLPSVKIQRLQVAIQQIKDEQKMPEGIQKGQIHYLNNIVEQDHRFIKKRVRSMQGSKL